MRPSCFIYLLVIVLLPAPANGQQPFDFKFQTYTTKDGLVHNYVKKCRQDSRGFLWIITQHGLSRFDGVSFKNFEHSSSDSTSLPRNEISDITIDSNNNIWLSYKTGLCFYNPFNNRFTVITENKKPLVSEAAVYDSRRNCIWSVSFSGYTKIDCAGFKTETIAFKEQERGADRISSAFLDSRQRLWISYNRSRYHCIDLQTAGQYFHAEETGITAFFEDAQNNIWASTWQTGFRKILANSTPHRHLLFSDPFLKVANNEYDFISSGVTESPALTGDSILWVIKSTDGILLFNKKKNRFVRQFLYDASNRDGIATDFNEHIYCDHDGIIWICTWHGLTKVNRQEQQFTSRELPQLRSQLYNCVSGMADDPYEPGIMWMGVSGSGVFKCDKLTGKILGRYFYYYNNGGFTGKDENYNWRWTGIMLTDSNKNIWTNTYGGLIRISKGAVTKVPLKTTQGNITYPYVIKAFQNGYLWVASGDGIYRVNVQDNSYEFYSDAAARPAAREWLGDLQMQHFQSVLYSSSPLPPFF